MSQNNTKKKYSFFKDDVFTKRNSVSLACFFLAIISIVLSFVQEDSFEWRMAIYSCLSILFISGLLLLLFRREKNLESFANKNIELNEQINALVENNKNLSIKNTKNDLLINNLKKKVDSQEYIQGQHALKILYNYSDIGLLLTFIKKIEYEIDQRYAFYKRAKKEEKIIQAYTEYIKKQDESVKLICESIAELMTKTFYSEARSVTVSIFTCHNVGSSPVALKQCSAFAGSNDKKGLYFTDGRSYPVMENTDFMEICDKFSRSDEHCFFCCGNLPQRGYYLDTNHKYHETGIYLYKKGSTEYKLHYKSLISSAIFDTNLRSNDSKNINGFLSVSSPSVDCFTRSDTLLLQVISAQLHDLCIKLNNRKK